MMAAITDVSVWMPSRTITDVMLGAVCTLASPLTAPWRQIQQTAAAEFPNARVVQSTTNPSTTTWLEGPHQHPMPLMWSPLDPITLSTVLMRSNQVPAIHSHHQEVTVLVSTRVFSTEKETHGKMAASMSAHVSMPRWENTNVYPNVQSTHQTSPLTVARLPFLDSAVLNSAVIFQEPMDLTFHHLKCRSHQPQQCQMAV